MNPQFASRFQAAETQKDSIKFVFLCVLDTFKVPLLYYLLRTRMYQTEMAVTLQMDHADKDSFFRPARISRGRDDSPSWSAMDLMMPDAHGGGSSCGSAPASERSWWSAGLASSRVASARASARESHAHGGGTARISNDTARSSARSSARDPSRHSGEIARGWLWDGRAGARRPPATDAAAHLGWEGGGAVDVWSLLDVQVLPALRRRLVRAE